jgi:hypothetical protein
MNFGSKPNDANQQPDKGGGLSYPCQGVKEAAVSLGSESPWPWPGHGAFGQPVLIQVAEGSRLALGTYSITRVGGPGIDAGSTINGSIAGQTTMIQKLDWSNDTNQILTNRYNVAMLMPDKTMMPGGVYRVQVTGTVDGTLFTKDFTFSTTGEAEYKTCLADANNNRLYGSLTPNYCAGGSRAIITKRTLNGEPTDFVCGSVLPTGTVVCKDEAAVRSDIF